MIAFVIFLHIDRTIMFDLCSLVSIDDLVAFCDSDGPRGLQCGIIVNDKDKRTVLVQTLYEEGDSRPYPNRWDDVIPGLIYYCATRKGVGPRKKAINLNSRLNMYVNTGQYPIFLFVRYPSKSFRYMGEFIRLSRYDSKYMDNDLEVYHFALISKNIEAIDSYVKEIKTRYE